jgi:rpsU-divergently transcribed protein
MSLSRLPFSRLCRIPLHLCLSSRSLCSSVSIRTQILDQALTHVSTMGWKEECLATAAKDLGLPVTAHRVVEYGAAELVCHFLEKKREHVNSIISKVTQDNNNNNDHTEQTSDGEEQLIQAIELHLQYLQPYRESWPEAMALCMDPRAVSITLPMAFQLTEDLCEVMDVRASYLDWYVERSLLFGLYGVTELYFLTDSSSDLADSRYKNRLIIQRMCHKCFFICRQFLRRSVQHYQKIRSSPSLLSALRSALLRF